MKSLKEMFKALPGNVLTELKAEKDKLSLNSVTKRVVLAVLFLIVTSVLGAIITGVFSTGIISSVLMILVVTVLLTVYQVLDRAIDKSA